MGHLVQLSEEAYQAIANAAAERGQTPEAFIEAWALRAAHARQQEGDADQAWFWTAEWQEGERRADADLAAGRFTRFESDEAFFQALDDWDTDADQ